MVKHKGCKRTWVGRAVVAVLMACATPVPAQPDAGSSATREYRVKAAFLYHFIQFVDGWRFERKGQDRDEKRPIRIGIIGRDPFKDAFDPLKDKRVRGRTIEVKYFKGLAELNAGSKEVERHPKSDDIAKCDLLFTCRSERAHFDGVLEPVRTEPILTVADTEGFLEAGGIVNFVAEESNIRFEINTAAAKRAKLTIRSKLLRLAKRIVKKDNVGKK